MQIEQRPLDSVRPYARNPRLNDHAVQAVADSIRKFGFRQPILVDEESVIICGHTRWKAAKTLGMETVPVHVATDMSPEDVRSYRIADNKLAELADWDLDLLPLELTALQDLGVDLGMVGFSADDLASILNPDVKDGHTDPDAIPEPPDDAVSERGHVYQLGTHRLMCGDSASEADLDLLLTGASIHMVNTDPPYNVKVEPRSNNAIAAGLSSFPEAHHQASDLARHPGKSKATHAKLRPKDRPLANDFMSDADFENILLAWFGNLGRVLVPGRAFYIWGGYANCANYPGALKASELRFSQAIIWVKHHPVLGRKDFMCDHEWCFYGWRAGAGHKFYGPANVRDVWEVKKVAPQRMVHLTEKPVELAIRSMQYSSRAGEHVLDLFGGSGSTLMAAEQTSRKAFLMELDPLYCDVIRRRWAEFVHGEGCDWQQQTPVLDPAHSVD